MSRTVPIPDWINESFLKTVLQQEGCEGRTVNVNKTKVTLAAPPGANYASSLFRVRGWYNLEDEPDKMKETSVIVKCLITIEFVAKLLEACGLGEKEYSAYSELLPEVYKILANVERFTAKLLYSTGPETLVLEDLKDQGFILVDRLKQLDFEHCKVCLKTVAKFHAVSVAVVKNKPEFIVKLGKEPLYTRDNSEVRERFFQMGKIIGSLFTKAVQTWKGFEDFEDKSRHVWETLQDDLCDVFEPRKDSLNVMNHGDLWLNNMMFRYDSDGNIVDFRLLDFQACRYGSPITDLVYFLFSSANQEVLENRLDELFSAYLETLNLVLEQLDCEERLTREQLDAELKRSQCYILTVTYSILATVLSDPDDLINLDEVTEESFVSQEKNPLEKGYYGKYYKDVAPKVLRYLYKQGFFERKSF